MQWNSESYERQLASMKYQIKLLDNENNIALQQDVQYSTDIIPTEWLSSISS